VDRLLAGTLDHCSYTLSAGIAHNKMLAKHASGMHKPFQQTVVRNAAVDGLMQSLPVNQLNGRSCTFATRICFGMFWISSWQEDHVIWAVLQ
jgi:DNA polymerase eta